MLVGENGVPAAEDVSRTAGEDGRTGEGFAGARNPGETPAAGQNPASVPDANSNSASQSGPELSRIYVYVCGAVNSPGVVVLPEGSRAEAALEAAGGLREDAKTDWVNLAAKVTDGEKLYFPTLDETPEAPDMEEPDGLVNINTADEAALCTLSGIGESRARDILRYREENGAFQSPEDIMKVPGIKTSVYNRIKDRIRTE